jgi:hypothetical protein
VHVAGAAPVLDGFLRAAGAGGHAMGASRQPNAVGLGTLHPPPAIESACAKTYCAT